MIYRIIFFATLLTFNFSCASTKRLQVASVESKALDKIEQEGSGQEYVDDDQILSSSKKNIDEEENEQALEQEIPALRPMATNAAQSIRDFNLHYRTEWHDYWVQFLSGKDKQRFTRHLRNGEKYFPVVKEILQQHGLPVELFFVGLIESGFNLRIGSHAGAVGPWQFMRGTARHYGLKINRQIDERMDIVKSTHAAANFFSDLYNIFGSWELALCAYNKGEYGIIRAIRKGNTRNYLDLEKRKLLPQETILYVPKVAAAMSMVFYPEKYGLPIIVKREDFKYSNVDPQVVAGVLQNLPSTTPYPETVSINRSNRQTVPVSVSRRSPAVAYLKVKKGDGLAQLSQVYGIDVQTIKKMNKINTNKIMAGQKLKLPLELKRYKVRKGENLQLIADKFGVTMSSILRHNSLKQKTIFPHQQITIPIAKN